MLDIIKRLFPKFFYVVIIAIFLWLILSYIEVISHNLDSEFYNYSNWNCFVILLHNYFPKY